MSDAAFTPTVYLKTNCPFCLKVRIFLLEAGLMGKVKVRDFVQGEPEEQAIKDELAPHLEKVTFPAAEIAPGKFIADSDGIVGHFAGEAKVDPGQMTVLRNYVQGPFQRMMDLFRENRELKAKVEG